MRCPTCTNENREGVTFCARCGARLPAHCPQWGNEVAADALFCDHLARGWLVPKPWRSQARRRPER
jgi:predicted amidophosphoribosyltransferase